MHKRSFAAIFNDPMGAEQGEMFRHGGSIASHKFDEFSHGALPATEAVHNLQAGLIGQRFHHARLLRECVAICHRSRYLARWPYSP